MHKKAQEGKSYYLYRHIRLDKPEVMYVGKGTVRGANTEEGLYTRAYNMVGRNKVWKRVYEKSGGCEVEIFFESHDLALILKKEMEFIQYYGRKDLGLGTLCNLTDGGESEPNYKHTDESRAKMAKSSNRPTGSLNPASIKIFAYTIDGKFYKEYDCMTDCSKDLSVSLTCISEIVNRETRRKKRDNKLQKSAKGFMFFKDYRGEWTDKLKKDRIRSVTLIDSDGQTLEAFESIRKAILRTGDFHLDISRSDSSGEYTKRGNRFKFIQ